VKNQDQSQRIAKVLSVCEQFEPILERELGELRRLQEQSSGATLEDAWTLRQRVEKAQKQIRMHMGSIFGASVTSMKTLERIRTRFTGHAEVFERIDTLWRGLPSILKAIPGCERELALSYVEEFCRKQESALEQIKQRLAQLTNAPPTAKLDDATELDHLVKSTKDQFGVFVFKVTHVRWEHRKFLPALEKLLDGHPELLERLNSLEESLATLEGKVNPLTREIRRTQSAAPPISRPTHGP
jgi:hypothetical protein